MLSRCSLIRAGRFAGLGLILLIVGGCALFAPASNLVVPPRDSLSAFSLAGRFSLRNEDKNYSGRLNWRHQGPANSLLLSSPFGQGMAEITTSESGARLTTSDGKIYTAADVESLTRQVLGYPLPLTLLTDWVRGQSKTPADRLDAQGRPVHLRHEDWRIDYSYDDDDPQSPPSLILAERLGGLQLRLKIDEWNTLSPDESAP